MFPGPTAFGAAGLEALVPKRGKLPAGDAAMVSLNWKLRLSLGHFGLTMPQKQKAKKAVTVLARASDLGFQGETGCCHRMEPRSLECLLERPCPRANINGN